MQKKYGKSTIETNILNENYYINGDLITSYKRLSIQRVYDKSIIRLQLVDIYLIQGKI